MPTSRATTIRGLIETIITTADSNLTFSYDPVLFDNVPKDQFPHCIILTEEEAPERLDFKQERRRVLTTVWLGYLVTPGSTAAATREALQLILEAIRDGIFADPDLTSTVDGSTISDTGIAQGRDEMRIYGSLEVTSEEVF